MFESIRNGMDFIVTDFEKGAEYNVAVAKSLGLNGKRDYFFRNLKEKTMDELADEILDHLT
ncbi:MAG: hypothetical protein LUD41_00585 [Phascolarctobacterium sp.]|nr:hypothetical protein [Phascolarctobacterium sp.]